MTSNFDMVTYRAPAQEKNPTSHPYPHKFYLNKWEVATNTKCRKHRWLAYDYFIRDNAIDSVLMTNGVILKV